MEFVLKIFIDADACPVKEEIYRVAERYLMQVTVVANTPMRVPVDERVQLFICRGFGEVDDWIADQVGPGDVAITADIPLASRCLEKGAQVLDPKGYSLTDKNIGDALGMRELMDYLRKAGTAAGGPSAITPKDRSRFLSKLDEVINSLRRTHSAK